VLVPATNLANTNSQVRDRSQLLRFTSTCCLCHHSTTL